MKPPVPPRGVCPTLNLNHTLHLCLRATWHHLQGSFSKICETKNLRFAHFLGVPLTYPTYKKGVSLPQAQGIIAVAFFKWTNGSEVMDDFLKRYILIRNSLVKIFPALIFLELVGKNTCETCAEGFCIKNFCFFLIFYSLCYKIKETSRRNFNIVICYFDPQNRFPLEKLSIFKKKSMSIRISVQKLFNILGFVIFRWRTYTKSVMCGSNSVWDIPPTQNFTFFAKRK